MVQARLLPKALSCHGVLRSAAVRDADSKAPILAARLLGPRLRVGDRSIKAGPCVRTTMVLNPKCNRIPKKSPHKMPEAF